eukprot:SAG31_NODE_6416_length_2028_cov_1.364438_2_plen_202_part_00
MIAPCASAVQFHAAKAGGIGDSNRAEYLSFSSLVNGRSRAQFCMAAGGQDSLQGRALACHRRPDRLRSPISTRPLRTPGVHMLAAVEATQAMDEWPSHCCCIGPPMMQLLVSRQTRRRREHVSTKSTCAPAIRFPVPSAGYEPRTHSCTAICLGPCPCHGGRCIAIPAYSALGVRVVTQTLSLSSIGIISCLMSLPYRRAY